MFDLCFPMNSFDFLIAKSSHRVFLALYGRDNSNLIFLENCNKAIKKTQCAKKISNILPEFIA